MKSKLKKNKFFILTIIFSIILVLVSFIYRVNLSYAVDEEMSAYAFSGLSYSTANEYTTGFYLGTYNGYDTKKGTGTANLVCIEESSLDSRY